MDGEAMRGRYEMNIGEPKREIIVEPLELPEPLRIDRPAEPIKEPEMEPVHHGN